MNELSPVKQAQIISAICEGASIRSAARQAEVSKNTVSRLIKNVAIGGGVIALVAGGRNDSQVTVAPLPGGGVASFSVAW